MKLLRRSLRSLLLFLHLLLGISLAFIIFIPWIEQRLPTGFSARVVVCWSGLLCCIFGLRIQPKGQIALPPTQFVANHISWLDIFAILSQFNVKFVSKSEVSNWPFIGWLSQRVGTLYIKRGKFEASNTVTQSMEKALSEGEHVLFFPEGTSTDGSTIKRFHARLFQAAMNQKTLIQPITLSYTHPETQQRHQHVPYIGDDNFLAYTWRIMGEKTIDLEMVFGEAIYAENAPRRYFSDYTQQQILTTLAHIRTT